MMEDSYWLHNASVPVALLGDREAIAPTRDGLVRVDLEIAAGCIRHVQPVAATPPPDPHRDVQRGLVLPCFADAHMHLDKGHIWERSPNPDGTFASALQAVRADVPRWQADDLYRRMQFSLQCSYAHGTQAIRTHLDCGNEQYQISLPVFACLQAEWRGKVTLQAASLVSLDVYQTPAGAAIADAIAQHGQLLGGVAYASPALDAQLDAVFTLAQERQLDLDFHADENGDPDSHCLRAIAIAALRHQFRGQILCGHCCSLAVQPPAAVAQTLALVQQAGIRIVSLPMCNLYLQDCQPARTPRWRGVTLAHELNQAGIPVAFASDNCRDPFFGFGDGDMLEVFEQSVRIAQLDRPYGNWIRAVTQTPAEAMGLPSAGRIIPGAPADLIVFRGRCFSELLSRSQHDRLVLRRGQPIDTTPPDYAELDDLLV